MISNNVIFVYRKDVFVDNLTKNIVIVLLDSNKIISFGYSNDPAYSGKRKTFVMNKELQTLLSNNVEAHLSKQLQIASSIDPNDLSQTDSRVLLSLTTSLKKAIQACAFLTDSH
jgi:hypothetical protein